MEPIRQIAKDWIAVTRHLATLAAGSVVVLAGFLSQSQQTFHNWTWWVLAVGFVAMLVCIDGYSDRVATGAFLTGLVCIAVFSVANVWP